jgi:poly(3-hydroxybutyrate) depolymerase
LARRAYAGLRSHSGPSPRWRAVARWTLAACAAVAAASASVTYPALSSFLWGNTGVNATAKTSSVSGSGYPYRLLLPPNYDAARKYPLIIFLHGSGEAGSDNTSQISAYNNTANGALALVSLENQATYPCFFAAPQKQPGPYWSSNADARAIADLINVLEANYSIDPKKIILTGLSSGGIGSFNLPALMTPNPFSCIVPMSGFGEYPDAMPHIPMWVFHAVDDSTVSILTGLGSTATPGSDIMVDYLRSKGYLVLYTRYNSGNHPIWPTAYQHPQLLPWMFAQALGEPMHGSPSLAITTVTQGVTLTVNGTSDTLPSLTFSRIGWTTNFAAATADAADGAVSSGSPQTLTSASSTFDASFVGQRLELLPYAQRYGDLWFDITSVPTARSLGLSYGAPSATSYAFLTHPYGTRHNPFPAAGSLSPSWTLASIPLYGGANALQIVGEMPTNSATYGGLTTINVPLTVESDNAPLLPREWSIVDVGPARVEGTVGYAAGAMTISASGYNIGDATDAFRYVYQATQGDCSIVVRVTDQQDTFFLTKAGIMIRESLDPTAGYVGCFATPSSGLLLQWRNGTAGPRDQVNVASAGVTLPVWLKLTRTGDVFTAYSSTDGANWSAVGSPQTIHVESVATLGVGVCSLNQVYSTRAVFDHLSAVATPNPVISETPVSTTVAPHGNATFRVVATAPGALTYQWYKNGAAISGATGAALTLNDVGATDTANYTVTISGGFSPSITTAPAHLLVATPVPGRVINLSVRSNAGAGDHTLIAGFVVGGSGTKPVLVRGIGPSLTRFGVANAVADPQLALYVLNATAPLVTNQRWGGTAELTAAFDRTGAFGLAADSRDTAVVTALPTGGYTAQVAGASGTPGVALIELYDDGDDATARLINVSARSDVGTGDNVLIAGFTVSGNVPKRLLIRGVGPTLRQFGVTTMLANPQVAVISRATGQTVAANDDWGGSAQLSAIFDAAGAFQLPMLSHDAALVVTLVPGEYSAIVSGVAGTTGVGMVEIYDLE